MDFEALDFSAFDIKLDTEWVGRNFIYLDECDSTNTHLMETDAKQLSEGTIVFAEKQEEGRGRMKRIWQSVKGQNLTFSIALKKGIYIKRANIVNLGTAITVANSIENLHQLPCDLKWPNDVLINKKKVSGILLESSSSGSKINKLVIGVGMNVNQSQFAGEYNYPPTSVKLELKQIVSRERLLAEFLNLFEETLEKVEHHPESILNDWRNNSRMIGERITVKTAKGDKSGIFIDIDDDGFMLLKHQDKVERITIGDVYY